MHYTIHNLIPSMRHTLWPEKNQNKINSNCCAVSQTPKINPWTQSKYCKVTEKKDKKKSVLPPGGDSRRRTYLWQGLSIKCCCFRPTPAVSGPSRSCPTSAGSSEYLHLWLESVIIYVCMLRWPRFQNELLIWNRRARNNETRVQKPLTQ